MTDDEYAAGIKAETKREVLQDLQYQAQLSERVRQLGEEYYKAFPDHRNPDLTSWVNEESQGYVARHPDFHVWAAAPEKLQEAFQEVGQAVEKRRERIATVSSGRSEEQTVRYEGYEPTDADREESMREDMERYEKTRRPA